MNVTHLPREILELIFRQLPCYSKYGSYGILVDEDTSWSLSLPLWPKSKVYPSQRLIAPIRLVCKAFYKAANCLFFATAIVRCNTPRDGTETSTRPIQRLLEFASHESDARHLKLLVVDLEEVDFSRDLFLDFGPNLWVMNERRYAKDNRESTNALVEALREAWMRACSTFRGLRTLDFRGPKFDFGYARDVHTHALLALQDIMADGFALMALERLEELRLELPCTHALTTIMSGPSLRGFQNLKTLWLQVDDDSGSFGKRFERMIDSDHEQRLFPASELQTLLPNTMAEHQGFLLNLSALQSLEQLTLRGSNFLNLDLLRLSTTQLKYLGLSRFWSSERALIAIVTQHSSTLQAVDFEEIELSAGTWEAPFISLLSCEKLQHFLADCCGYAPDGSSSHYRVETFRRWESSSPLETENFPDECALGDLQRAVDSRRRHLGMPPDFSERYGDSVLSHADQMSLAEWRERSDAI